MARRISVLPVEEFAKQSNEQRKDKVEVLHGETPIVFQPIYNLIEILLRVMRSSRPAGECHKHRLKRISTERISGNCPCLLPFKQAGGSKLQETKILPPNSPMGQDHCWAK